MHGEVTDLNLPLRIRVKWLATILHVFGSGILRQVYASYLLHPSDAACQILRRRSDFFSIILLAVGLFSREIYFLGFSERG